MPSSLPPEPLSFGTYRTSYYRETIHRNYHEFKHRYGRVEEYIRSRQTPPFEEYTLFHLLSIWAATNHWISLISERIRFELRYQYSGIDQTMVSLLRTLEYLPQSYVAQFWSQINDRLALKIYTLEKEPDPPEAPENYQVLQADYTRIAWFQKGLRLYPERGGCSGWSEVFLDPLIQEHFRTLWRKEQGYFRHDSTYPEEFWWLHLL